MYWSLHAVDLVVRIFSRMSLKMVLTLHGAQAITADNYISTKHSLCGSQVLSILSACSPGLGLNCIVSIGLDEFTCCLSRPRAFIQQRASLLALLILLKTAKGFVNGGIGLVDGILSDHRLFILVHQHELLAPVPSSKVRLLIDV